MNQLLNRLKPFLYVGGLYIIISLVLRIIFYGTPYYHDLFFYMAGLGNALGG